VLPLRSPCPEEKDTVPHPIRSALAVCCALTLPQGALAVTIDNFEEGDFLITDPGATPGATLGLQTGLNPANVVGGTRQVGVTAVAGLTATAELTTTPADDSVALSNNLGAGFYAFIYDGVANTINDENAGTLGVDLSSFDAIEVEAINAGANATIQLGLWDSTTGEWVGPSLPLVSGTNFLTLPDPGPSPFGEVDLTDIQSIRVRVAGLQGSASISEIRAGNLQAAVDLKPGDALNCVNPNAKGRVTVAVLGSSDFDVLAVDPSSLSFGGAAAMKCKLNDVAPVDGFTDLTCKYKSQQVAWPAPGSNCGQVVLTGSLGSGSPIEGSDLACLTGENACESGAVPLP
jgi:hypothetical protein